MRAREHRVFGVLELRHAELELVLVEHDPIAVSQLALAADALAIDERAVHAALVTDPEREVAVLDQRVTTADRALVDDEVIDVLRITARDAPDQQWPRTQAQVTGLGDAVDVLEIRLGHLGRGSGTARGGARRRGRWFAGTHLALAPQDQHGHEDDAEQQHGAGQEDDETEGAALLRGCRRRRASR